MKVSELIIYLQSMPQDLDVIYEYCSDYQDLTEDSINIVEAVYKPGVNYFMRAHRTMSEENKKKVATYLAFPGN